MGNRACIVWAVLLASATLACARAFGAENANTTQPVADTRAAADVTADRLNEKIEAFKATAEPLADVIHRIEAAHNLKFNVRWDALAKTGVTQKTPVTLQVRAGLRTREVLKYILLSLNAPIKDPDLAAQRSVLDNGEILVTTRSDLFTHFTSVKNYPLPRSGNGLPIAGSGVISMLKDSLPPGSWAEKSGAVGGSVVVEGDHLVVTQTEENHRLVAAAIKPLFDG
jgi:hypothetical protein